MAALNRLPDVPTDSADRRSLTSAGLAPARFWPVLDDGFAHGQSLPVVPSRFRRLPTWFWYRQLRPSQPAR